MKKTKEISCLLLLLVIPWMINSQVNKSSCCKVYLEPIFGFDLKIGDNHEQVFENFDKYSQTTADDELKYKPKDVKVFTASKRIILPNGFSTDVFFNFHFKQKSLITYNLTFSIGSDYKYFWQLIDYIKKYDNNEINHFIYNSGQRPSYLDLSKNKNCKRMFSVVRSYKNNKLYNISCRVD